MSASHALLSLTGSTDFGNVTFEVPGIHPYFYIGSNALNHTPEYTVAAGMSDYDLALSASNSELIIVPTF